MSILENKTPHAPGPEVQKVTIQKVPLVPSPILPLLAQFPSLQERRERTLKLNNVRETSQFTVNNQSPETTYQLGTPISFRDKICLTRFLMCE